LLIRARDGTILEYIPDELQAHVYRQNYSVNVALFRHKQVKIDTRSTSIGFRVYHFEHNSIQSKIPLLSSEDFATNSQAIEIETQMLVEL
jgi:hypothetical protein